MFTISLAKHGVDKLNRVSLDSITVVFFIYKSLLAKQATVQLPLHSCLFFHLVAGSVFISSSCDSLAAEAR